MARPINPVYPVTDVYSIDQLMAIAVGVEHEAAARYRQLAEIMDRRGATELAGTFRHLSDLEHAHELGLGAWARREGRTPPEPLLFAWQFPETFAWEDAGDRPPSPYLALSVAVRNEERAFSFYTYLAAQAAHLPEVRQRAEALAREELNHVAMLRRLRRQAYHGQKGPRQTVAVSTGDELRQLADQLERTAAQLALVAAVRLQDEGQPGAALLLRQIAADAAHGAASPAAAPRTATIALGHCETEARQTLETYLTIAETAKDEDLLHAAQDLAEKAMARLAIVTNCRRTGL